MTTRRGHTGTTRHRATVAALAALTLLTAASCGSDDPAGNAAPTSTADTTAAAPATETDTAGADAAEPVGDDCAADYAAATGEAATAGCGDDALLNEDDLAGHDLRSSLSEDSARVDDPVANITQPTCDGTTVDVAPIGAQSRQMIDMEVPAADGSYTTWETWQTVWVFADATDAAGLYDARIGLIRCAMSDQLVPLSPDSSFSGAGGFGDGAALVLHDETDTFTVIRNDTSGRAVVVTHAGPYYSELHLPRGVVTADSIDDDFEWAILPVAIDKIAHVGTGACPFSSWSGCAPSS